MKKPLFFLLIFMVLVSAKGDNLIKQTALHVAAEKGLQQVVSALINAGIDINAVDSFGNTALHLAIHHEEVVRILLNAGANPNIQNTFQKTPLHYGITRYNIVSLLLEYGADPNIKDMFSYTALDLMLNFPLGYRREEIMLLLIQSMQL